MSLPAAPLSELVQLSDSGTWGDDAGDGTGVPVLRSTNIVGDRLSMDDVAMRVIPLRDRERKRLAHGDIIVTKSSGSPSHIGKCCLIEGRGDLYFSNFMLRLRVDPTRVSPEWLHYWLSSDMGKRHVASASTTTTGLRNIDLDHYLSQRVPVPPLHDQHRYHAVLSRARSVLDARKRSLALTDDLLRATFLEMFGDLITNPRGWEARPLRSIADLASGVTKGKRYASTVVERPYLRVANVQAGSIDLSEVKTIQVSEADAERYLLREGDILLTEGGDPDKLGRGAVWRGEVPDCIHQNHIFRARVDPNLVDPEFLSAQLGSPRGARYFARAAKQTTGIASINMTQLSQYPALVPPIAEQRRYSAAAEAIRAARRRQEEALVESERLFASLQHRAFQGEL